MSSDDIFKALDALGLEFARRVSRRGTPYAAFRFVQDSGDAAITALAEHDVLRLTSHGIDTSFDALEIVRAGARLPLGAAYRSAGDGSAELSVGLFMGEAVLSKAILSPLLQYLVRATRALQTDDASVLRPAIGDVTQPSQIDIRGALQRFGHQVTEDAAGFRITLPLTPTAQGSIALSEDAGLIVGRASYVPDRQLPQNPDAVQTVQRLQEWTAAGRFRLDDTLTLSAEVMTPLLGDAPEHRLVWTASQCAAMLQTAARHLEVR